jgi:hypothetical protein
MGLDWWSFFSFKGLNPFWIENNIPFLGKFTLANNAYWEETKLS